MKGFGVALLMVLAALSPPAAAFGAEEVQVVEEEGMAAVSGGDVARAYKEAVADALQKAVLKVVQSLGRPEAEKDKALRERIMERAEGFVKDYRVILSLPDPDLYVVRLRATVFAGGLRQELQRFGLSGGEAQSRAVSGRAVVISGIRNYREYHRCRQAMAEASPDPNEARLREIGRGTLRYEVEGERPLSEWGGVLKERLAAEVLLQDEGRLIVQIRQ